VPQPQTGKNASFSTIQPEKLTVAESDAPEALDEVGQSRCFHRPRPIIPWVIPKKSQFSWQTVSISFATVSLIPASPMP
jgi:hypothetical protein